MDQRTALAWLQDLLRIKTVLDNETAAVDYIENLLRQSGVADVQRVAFAPGRDQLIATIKGGEGPVLGLCGHLDVVPVGEEPWRYDPFGGHVADGRIYGRGSADMKAGVMALVMAAISRSSAPFGGTLKLMLTACEEKAAQGAAQLTQLGYADDLDALFIAEPTDGQLCLAHRGALWLRLTVRGKTAHGSTPQHGVNAVEHMVRLLGAFMDVFDFGVYTDGLMGCGTCSIDVIRGGNATNVVPDVCTAEMDLRTVPDQDHDKIVEEVRRLIDEVQKADPCLRAQVEVICSARALRTDACDPFVDFVRQTAHAVTGKLPAMVSAPYFTDGSNFIGGKNRFPVVIMGPGEPRMAHQPDESVALDDYYTAIAVADRLVHGYFDAERRSGF